MNARCPHLVFRDVLGASTVAALLDYAAAREPAFRPGIAYDRRSGATALDAQRRDCLLLDDLGPFRAPFAAVVDALAGPALAQLRTGEPVGEPRELEISAYGDGGHFNPHVDTVRSLDRVRVLSCVYYFAATPPRFRGGELRLHALPALPGKEATGTAAFVDVAPETDTLVVFPSWLRHEVRPVATDSDAWGDRRFAINCWIHRAAPPAAPPPSERS
jgi:SM-20-related protein